ncbi:MAG: hypothetical protein JWM19_4911 [Actinomycetia bacterium]|nr:hypothetical protein [Actinomycetes bacterium]
MVVAAMRLAAATLLAPFRAGAEDRLAARTAVKLGAPWPVPASVDINELERPDGLPVELRRDQQVYRWLRLWMRDQVGDLA